jgi:Mg/Co/Ni transporter MgtE
MGDQIAPGTSVVKRTATGAAIGAVLGFVASSVIGPAVISWWYEPPSKDAFSCAGSVKAALSQFVTMQLISAAVGAAGLAVTLFALRRGKGAQSAPPA